MTEGQWFWLIIFITGYIACYGVGRNVRRAKEGKYYSWADVGVLLLHSLSSWVGVCVILFIEGEKSLNFGKPPKWL